MPRRSVSDAAAREMSKPSQPSRIIGPTEWFGFRLGSDQRLARWPDLLAYYRHLAARSERVQLTELGASTDGLPLVSLTISHPDNLANVPRLQAVQQRLANQRPQLRPDEMASLTEEGRTICLITCSIHGTEVGATQMVPELVHALVTRDDAHVREILRNVILLLVPSLNPDGLEMVAEWYAEMLDTPYEGSPPPRLYHRYAGHDNNRDWFMQALVETRAIVRHLHNPWRPHIVFDLHQMQANGPRYFVPPFVDPYDPNVDPLIQAQANALGSAMAADLLAAGKTGIATSVIFDAYSPSRAYQHYHGGVRILSEAAGVKIATPVHLTPDQLVESRGFDPKVSLHNHPIPWPGGRWTLRDIVEHNLIAAMSVLTHAARYRDRWLRNFATIQKRALEIERPFAFILPGYEEQRDPGALRDLLEVLHRGDVEIERATGPFTARGRTFPAGTFIVRVAQPFGRFAKTLLEIQRYPEVPAYPGGPLRPPYDNAGHTLPLLLGVDSIQADEPFDVTTEVCAGIPAIVGGVTSAATRAQAYLLGAETNASTKVVVKLLYEDEVRVSRLTKSHLLGKDARAAGTYVIAGVEPERLDALARQHGVAIEPIDVPPDESLARLRMPRIGLYSSWRPNAIDTGWTRYVLEEYGFTYQEVRDAEVRRGLLGRHYDVLIFSQEQLKHIVEGNSLNEYPRQYAGGIGEPGVANVRRFVEAGGTLITLDSACDLAIKALRLPVYNVLDGRRPDQFASPGSLLSVHLDVEHPVAWGLPESVAAMFVSSPAFAVEESPDGNLRVVGRYPQTNPLLSGWIRGPEHLIGRAAIVEAAVGKGKAILIGFRPQYRAQARRTYRLLFNSILTAGLET